MDRVDETRVPCINKSHLHTRAAEYSLPIGQPTATNMDDRNTPLVPLPPLETQPIIPQEPYSVSPQVSVPTPSREPSFRKGAYTSNILRLEQSAEKMSEGGSDIGEEIRKMQELERQRSRQNSIQSSHYGDATPGRSTSMAPLDTTRSRASSHAQSLADANNTARWGGQSPNSYITSPVGSVRSHGSWVNRKPSVSSKLSHMVEPIQEGRPLDSPLAPSLRSPLSIPSMSRQVSHASVASVSSFGAKYDKISAQIQEQLEDVPPTPPHNGEFTALGYAEEGAHEGKEQGNRTVTPPTRPRSSDTFREAELAFKDFDGVHYLPDTEEIVTVDEDGNEVRRVSARTSNGTLSMEAASLLRAPQSRPMSFAMPPPAENSVYYPAPVPRMLNLPKRLSQMPSANVYARGRNQVLSQLPPGTRQSVPWLSQSDLGAYGNERRSGSGEQPGDHPRPALNQRMSMATLHNLPPQLRASVFFEQQGIPQDVEIQNRSAVATLEDILNASATAPVSAFVDHPFAGDVRKSHFAAERPTTRHSTATLVAQASNPEPEAKAMKRRTTSLGNLLKRSSSADQLGDMLKRPGSRSSMSMLDFNGGGKKLQKRKSRASMLDMQQEEEDDGARPKTPGTEVDLSRGLVGQAENGSPVEERRVSNQSRPATAMSGGRILTENEQIVQDFADQEADEGVEEDEEHEASFVQPATLLAELQVRKAQLKSRNRTAATAFPGGMHSTLLQMDAVEEITTRKRRQQRVNLAWEDPLMRQAEEERGDTDDDVPLGVLYPSKNGLINRKMGDERDWDRPLGLMEKRELENNEPLSSRRNRLLGGPALPRNLGPSSGRAPVPLNSRQSQINLVADPGVAAEGEGEAEREEADEGETLGQRLKRLRTKNALDKAIGHLDVPPQDGERPVSTWSEDMLNQFAGMNPADKENATAPDGNAAASTVPQLTPPTQEELENETLGQRRARLQREREAAEAAGITPEASAAPAVRQSRSMADLLAANPSGAAKRLNKDHQPARGTLLHNSEQEKARNRRSILQTNMRSASYAPAQPDQRRAGPTRAVSNFAMPQQPNMMAAGFGGYNGMPTSTSTPMFAGANSYFPSPTAAFQQQNMPMVMGMAGYAQPQMQMQMPMQVNHNAYQALNGGYPQQVAYGMPMSMPMSMGMGMGGMGMPMAAGGYEEGISPQQRDKIDRWRMSVAPQ